MTTRGLAQATAACILHVFRHLVGMPDLRLLCAQLFTWYAAYFRQTLTTPGYDQLNSRRDRRTKPQVCLFVHSYPISSTWLRGYLQGTRDSALLRRSMHHMLAASAVVYRRKGCIATAVYYRVRSNVVLRVLWMRMLKLRQER